MPERPTHPGEVHADRALLEGWRSALCAWESSAAPTWPTSQVLGGGAVAAVEELVSGAHDGRPCLLLPSATYALRVALAVAGIGVRSRVTIVEDDWPAAVQATRALGAEVDLVRPSTARMPSTGLGQGPIVVADRLLDEDLVLAVRSAAPGALVIEDASRLHPMDPASPVRRRSGDFVVYSLGPAKPVDAGEGGLLVCPDAEAHRRALGLSAHPTRLAFEKLAPQEAAFPMRVHPMTAILAWWLLSRADSDRHPSGGA